MKPNPNETFLTLFLRRLYSKTVRIGWDVVGCLALVHFVLSWVGMAVVGESEIAASDVFFYFYAVTVSTIGYGDFSPSTLAGRLFFVLFVLPGGIAIFTAVIGKAVGSIASLVTVSWRNAMKGRNDHSALIAHTVVFGWDPVSSPRLVDQLGRDVPDDSAPEIVLVSDVLDENPDPERLRFVRSTSMSSADALRRSGTATACVAILSCQDDARTLETGIAIGALPERPRIVALFRDEERAILFEKAVPNSETAVALSAETLARTARDPGTADLQRRILSVHDDHSQFSDVVSAGTPVPYGRIFERLRKDHGACAIGTMRQFGVVDVNPADDVQIVEGETVFYIASGRIDQALFDAMIADIRRG